MTLLELSALLQQDRHDHPQGWPTFYFPGCDRCERHLIHLARELDIFVPNLKPGTESMRE